MSRRNKQITFGLAVSTIGITSFLGQPSIPFWGDKAISPHVMAQDSTRIRQSASTTTVFIQSLNRPDVFGSGVIINRTGRTYTVVTAKHVVSLTDDYVVTLNGEKFAIQQSRVKGLSDVDLAILQFETDQPLTVATLNPSIPRELDRIYVAGYPKPTASVPSIEFTISPGDVNTLIEPAKARSGYLLRYTARTRVGMSGGSVLNDRGQLVAIHGEADELGGLAIPLQPYWSALIALAQTAPVAIATPPSSPSPLPPSPVPPVLSTPAPSPSVAPSPKSPAPPLTPLPVASISTPKIEKVCQRLRFGGQSLERCEFMVTTPGALKTP